MSIVVEYENELYSLLVDEIGDVETPPSHLYERPPATFGPAWRTVCSGVYRMDEALLLTLDIAKIARRRLSKERLANDRSWDKTGRCPAEPAP